MVATLDPVAAAEKEGILDIARTERQAEVNRISTTDPFGQLTYSQADRLDAEGNVIIDPYTQQPITDWSSNFQLNQPLQETLTSMQNVGAGRASLAEGSLARYWDEMKDPMDFDQYGDPIQMGATRGVGTFDYNVGDERARAEEAAYGRATARLDPQFEARRSSTELKLRNQGLQPGDQAYDSAMASLGRESADAYEMARLGSVSEGRTEQAQGYGQALGTSQQQAALGGQEFGQETQETMLANQLRSQGMAEGIGQRNFYLDEINKQLGGVTVPGVPQAPTPQGNLTLEQG